MAEVVRSVVPLFIQGSEFALGHILVAGEEVAKEDLVHGEVAHVRVLLQRNEAGARFVVMLLHELQLGKVELNDDVGRIDLIGSGEIGLGLGKHFPLRVDRAAEQVGERAVGLELDGLARAPSASGGFAFIRLTASEILARAAWTGDVRSGPGTRMSGAADAGAGAGAGAWAWTEGANVSAAKMKANERKSADMVMVL